MEFNKIFKEKNRSIKGMRLDFIFNLHKNNALFHDWTDCFNHVKNIRKILELNEETQSFLHFFA